MYHPGRALFHEGSKGWTCCKRRVLEFDEFMKIEGCKKKKRHLFVGKSRAGGEEKVETVRWVMCSEPDLDPEAKFCIEMIFIRHPPR